MLSYASHKYEGILTCDEDPLNILRTPCPPISNERWHEARLTVQKLMEAREKILKGGAGLAAPQIGINHPIFIYTPNRTTESLRVVINPSFEPLGNVTIEGEEACFSAPLRCTKLKRWEKIKVCYQNLEGELIEDTLKGFESKVFQHEMDHLQGKLTLDHLTANVKTFEDAESFQAYMVQIYQEDGKQYKE